MSDDEPKDPPKRRRKPPRSLEGFETGIPDDDLPEAPGSGGIPAKPLWTEPSTVPRTSESPEVTGAIAPHAAGRDGVVEDPGAPSIEVASGEGSYGGPDVVLPEVPAEVSAPRHTDPVAGPDPGAPVEPPGVPPTAPTRIDLATVPPAPLAGPSHPGAEAPLLPASYSREELHDAIGAKPPKTARKPPEPPGDDDDDGDGPPRNRKLLLVAVASLVIGLGVAATIFIGRANSGWYYITCQADRIIVEQGRAFPPWGQREMSGKQWTAIGIPPDAECLALETDDEDELSTQFRTLLIKRASILLTAKEVTKTEEANHLLEQALLHTRSNKDASRDARADIQRLLGDVAYWRASLKMHEAAKALVEAAQEFDAASQQRPRHVDDAAAWAEHVRKIVGDLEAGPSGTAQTSFPPTPPTTTTRPPAPPGVALPIEPDRGSASELPPVTPDAGVPTGGVLL